MIFTDKHSCGCQVIVSTETKQTIIYYCKKHDGTQLNDFVCSLSLEDTSYEDHNGSPIIELQVSESEWEDKLNEAIQEVIYADR